MHDVPRVTEDTKPGEGEKSRKRHQPVECDKTLNPDDEPRFDSDLRRGDQTPIPDIRKQKQ